MKKIRLRPALVFKIVIGMFMVAAVIVIVQNFIDRSRGRPRVPVVSEDITEQKVETTDEIQHYQLSKGKRHLEVRAAKHYIGQDGLFHLGGDVQVVFPERADGEDIILTAREIVHDPEYTFFRMLGTARLKAGDLTMASEWLEYRTEEEILSTDQPIQFASDRVSGSAKGAVYRARPERLLLQGEVEVTLNPAREPSRHVLIQGEELDYWHKKASGTIKGDVRIESETSHARAAFMRFELFSNRENLKSVFMQGEVHVVLSGEPDPAADSKEQSDSAGELREIRAEEVFVRAWHNSSDIRSLEATGDCSLRQTTPEGDHMDIDAERLEMAFNRGGKMKSFLASGGAFMEDEREGETRTIWGDSLSMEGRKNALNVKGKPDLRARIKAGDYQIEADTIFILLKNRNLEAEGGVIAVMEAQETSTPAVGFFTGGGGIFINADSMRYLGENRRFMFMGGIKLWQGQEMMMTEELTLFRETGRLTCRKGVKTHLMVQPRPQEEARRLEISSESLVYQPEDFLLNYQGEVKLLVEDVDLSAKNLYVRLSEQDHAMESVIARGAVRIKRGAYEALSEEALFDLNQETIELMGSPVLIDKQRVRIQGDKLTFHLADDRIVVENSDRERSKTVIKS
jgi:lipopolysaccharide export system protein LptA